MQPLPSPHTQASALVPGPAARWQVRLLGAVEANDGHRRIVRFPSRAVAALLARLALSPGRAHAREELVELLWPGVELAVGRNRLRQALSSLKSLLEPAGAPGLAVLQADRLTVRALPGALDCDARAFEALARAGQAASARAVYGGDFMPGYYDEWIHDERLRLSALHAALAAVEPPVAATHFSLPAATAQAPLPSYMTRLFGAEAAAAQLRDVVCGARLVTLLGPGGSGKTRLAVEVAQGLRSSSPFERVAFVSLLACEDAAQMLDAIARALQLPAAGWVDALAGQQVLLVLDNFEQLPDAAAAALAETQAALPRLHLLTTSRRALGLDGEVCIVAEPLALVPAGASLEQASDSPAVALFVDRARAVRGDFQLSPGNHRAIVDLVRALHGMPLAIELAASRVRSFAPAEMLGLLGPHTAGGHLALLARSGPRASHDPRHASMAEVIAWSWRLLDAPQQQLLAALSLFAVDATAAAVAAAADAPLAEVAAALDGLVAQSLIQAGRPGDGQDGVPQRFSVFEPVREYVLTQLPADDAQRMRVRIRQWLVRWAQGLGSTAAPARVAPELANVHAVLAHAEDAPDDALALMLALRGYWDTDALPGRIQAALASALQHSPESPAALVSAAHELLALLRFQAGLVHAARAHADKALAAAGAHASLRARALVRRAWVDIAGTRGDDEANDSHLRLFAQLDEALQLARRCGDREAEAVALAQQGVMAVHVQHNSARAETLMAQSQALWLALGEHRKANARLRNRAQCWVQMGRLDDALAAYEHCAQAARDSGDWVGQIDTLLSQAGLLSVRRQWAPALHTYQQCVQLCWQRWHRHGLAYALWNPPRLLARLGRPEAAMQLMGFAAAFWLSSFGPLGRSDQLYLRRVRGLVSAQLGATRAMALERQGAEMDLKAAVALALQDA